MLLEGQIMKRDEEQCYKAAFDESFSMIYNMCPSLLYSHRDVCDLTT